MRVLGVVPGRRGLSVAPVLRHARRAAPRSRAGRAADSAGLRYVKTGPTPQRTALTVILAPVQHMSGSPV